MLAQNQNIEELVARLASLADARDVEIPDHTVQMLMYLAVKLYSEKLEDMDIGENNSKQPFPPFPIDSDLTPTDIIRSVNRMLKATDIELFELGLWQAWGKL